MSRYQSVVIVVTGYGWQWQCPLWIYGGGSRQRDPEG